MPSCIILKSAVLTDRLQSWNLMISDFQLPLFQWNFQTRLYEKGCWRKMDEAKPINKIILNLPKEKVSFINNTYQKELNYWKKIVLEGKDEDEKKQLTDLAPLGAFWVRKDVVKNKKKCRRDNFLFKNAVSTTQSRPRNNFNWRHSKSRKPSYIWDNICSIKTFFEINKGSWKYDTEKQIALRGLDANSSESIQTREK